MSQHTEHSSYRERLIEHLFVAELLKLSWLHHNCSLEVAKPEVDNSGYDLIVEAGETIRHVQLKTSRKGGKTASQKVLTGLDPIPWTSSERWVRCPEWDQARRDDERGDSLRRSSGRARCGWCEMRGSPSGRWPVSWI